MPRRAVVRDERAVSPVIATIIIVAVAIVMSIAVAYWMLGLVGTFTRYEKLEIITMYAERVNDVNNGWNITAKLKSTGTAAATVNLILLNGRPASSFNAATGSANVTIYYGTNLASLELQDVEEKPVTIEPGGEVFFRIFIASNTPGFKSGVSVEVTFHTAAGSDYPKVVVLP